MKKLYLNMVLALTVAFTSFGFTGLTAKAETLKPVEWHVVYENNSIKSPDYSSINHEVSEAMPGDTFSYRVYYQNNTSEAADFYMSSEVVKTLEEGSRAAGGAYSYKITQSGNSTPLFESKTVGGGDLDANYTNDVDEIIGLEQVNGNKNAYFSLGTVSAKSGYEDNYIEVTVALDGNSQTNSYMDTLGSLQIMFGAQPTTSAHEGDKVEKHNKITKHVVEQLPGGTEVVIVAGDEIPVTGGNPQTGDSILPLIICGIALLIGILLILLYFKMTKAVVLVFAAAILMMTPMSADAKEYTYSLKIALGNNPDAYFDEEYIAKLDEQYEIAKKGDYIEITDLAYNKSVDIDVDALIKINPNAETGESKYYLAGLRPSGADEIITQCNKDETGNRNVSATFNVTFDETYVAAYGVGQAIPYDVKYVDKDGNELLKTETYYAARGELLKVPARHVNGYYPDAYYKTASKGLRENTVFTFIYKKNAANTVTIDDTVYEYSTEYGETTYEYQYLPATTKVVNGGTRTNRTTAGGNNTTANGANGAAGANGTGAANGADAANGAQAGDNQQGDEQFEDGQSAEDSITADSDLPLEIIDIDEEDVAKAGADSTSSSKNKVAAIIIATIALVAVIATIIVLVKKKKKAPVLIKDSDTSR